MTPPTTAPRRLFAPDAPTETWAAFAADGFADPVAGIVYDGARLRSGVPLGGLGTGYVELRGDGRLGATTIFNDFPTPRDLACPFLAVALDDDVRVLALDAAGVEQILYWGHYPVADLSYRLDLPLEVTLRAWSPFIPGDAGASNVPAANFELRLAPARPALGPTRLRVLLAFPGPAPTEAEQFLREPFEDRDGAGVAVTHLRHGAAVGYALAVARDERAAGVIQVHHCAAAGTARFPWPQLGTGNAGGAGSIESVPEALPAEPGTGLLVDTTLPQRGPLVLRFVLAWYYPLLRFGHLTHRYGTRFAGARDVARYVLREHRAQGTRTLAWQEAIYRQEDLPLWLRDALVNGLYSLAKNTWWTVTPRPDDRWGPEGLLTHNESFTGCPITETMVCRFHGHFPLLFLFPELERRVLETFAAYQLPDGQIPFCFGSGPGHVSQPLYDCQHPLNSAQFVQLVYRYFCATGDRAFLAAMLPSVKRAVSYAQGLDSDGDGLVNEHSHAFPDERGAANQFYDGWTWRGTSVYVAGIWLATLRCAEAIARDLGDRGFAADCRLWRERGLAAFDAKLWTGSYYRLYAEPETGRRSDLSLCNQLMGEWCLRLVGLGGLLPAEHVGRALTTVARLNLRARPFPVNAVGPNGSVGARHPDGRSVGHAVHCFVGENLCAAMTFLYAGQRRDGEELARTLLDALCRRHPSPWNQHCLLNSEDGRPQWGSDYYSNLVVWALPLALRGQDIAAFVRSPQRAALLAGVRLEG